ncbi:MAG: hypothetical protein CSB33_01875 [Desulfobacterales bacterium]|nr:MAG: hypothetical protein CSB33_01875 [Desulfobacterales bacterium]
MSEYEQLVNSISMSMGAAWASGINLYATLLMLGILGVTGNIVLPENLHILMHPAVIGASGLMFVAEFFADKTPGVDSGWDAIHTFIRIPAGAMLAAGAIGEVNPAMIMAAGILGGGLSAGTHAAKAGARALINTSPEPFTNWAASVTEDIAVIAGVWTALQHPMIFIGFLALFLFFLAWLLPKIWRGIKKAASAVMKLFSRRPEAADADPGTVPLAAASANGTLEAFEKE